MAEKKLNELGKSIVMTAEKARLDAQVKKLLSQKQILAYILKYAVPEFAEFSIDQIIPLIDTVSVASVPMEPGATNAEVIGLPQESKIVGESFVTYDIRFHAAVPGTEDHTTYRLIINIEAQGEPNQTYDLETRAVFYCARMLSEQWGRNVTKEHYENLVKVYSIFICMNCAQKDANTISEYGMTQRRCIGNYTKHPRIDLQSVVMVRLPKSGEEDKAKNPKTELTGMLATLLSDLLPAEEKIRVLENDYGMEMTEEIKEVKEMGTYSDVIERKGIEKGIRIGEEKGIRIGEARGEARGEANGEIRGMVRIYHEEMGLTVDQIAQKIGKKSEDIEKIIKAL